MSKKAIKKLSETHKSYDLTVESTTIQEAGTLANGQAGIVSKPAAKVIITIFEHGEKGAVILKKSAAYGSGSSFEESQNAAIEKAVEGLGL
jgi:hypothetical protein